MTWSSACARRAMTGIVTAVRPAAASRRFSCRRDRAPSARRVRNSLLFMMEASLSQFSLSFACFALQTRSHRFEHPVERVDAAVLLQQDGGRQQVLRILRQP